MCAQAAIEAKDLLRLLHVHVAHWFKATYPAFTHAQLLAVPAILDRESILLTSPTGSGKTLAGFLGIFDALLRKLDAGTLGSSVQCIYVSPLRALAYDIGKNVHAPLVGMGREKKPRVHLRTGDTPSSARVKFRQRAAHILIYSGFGSKFTMNAKEQEQEGCLKRERSGPCDPLLPHMSEASP